MLVANVLFIAGLLSPMWVPSQSPLQSFHLAQMPAVPAPREPGEWRIERADNWTNVWIDQRPNLLLDYEAIDSRLGIATALTKSVQLQLTIENRTGTGGRLDPLIENVHRIIGNHDTRATVPRNTVNIRVDGVSRHSLGPFSRAASATLTKSVGEYAASVSFRVPHRSSEPFGPDGIDTGTSLAWSRDISGTTVHLGAAVSRFAHVSAMEKTLFAAAVHPLTERTAVIAQYLFNSGIGESGPLATASHEVTVGARFHVTANTSFDAGIIENVFNFYNGPDFGFHFGLVYDAQGRR